MSRISSFDDDSSPRDDIIMKDFHLRNDIRTCLFFMSIQKKSIRGTNGRMWLGERICRMSNPVFQRFRVRLRSTKKITYIVAARWWLQVVCVEQWACMLPEICNAESLRDLSHRAGDPTQSNPLHMPQRMNVWVMRGPSMHWEKLLYVLSYCQVQVPPTLHLCTILMLYRVAFGFWTTTVTSASITRFMG